MFKRHVLSITRPISNHYGREKETPFYVLLNSLPPRNLFFRRQPDLFRSPLVSGDPSGKYRDIFLRPFVLKDLERRCLESIPDSGESMTLHNKVSQSVENL